MKSLILNKQNFHMKIVILFFELIFVQIVSCLPTVVNKDTRVIGGEEVVDGAVPYQVSIQNTFGEHVCGGSIINKYWILTAAHCMDWPKEYLKIATGSVKWNQPDAEYEVEDIRKHHLFNNPMYHNDIALIKLKRPIKFNARTKAVRLALKNSLNEGDKLVLTGWGSTKVWGHTPDVLHTVDLSYLPLKICNGKVRNAAWLGEGHICSISQKGKGSCNGDSGGPLVDKNQIQVGIVNWGEPCAVGYPDVYASVAYYSNWIKQQMKQKKNI